MTAPAPRPSRKCPDCGTENPPNSDYCSKCAHPLTATTTGESPIPDPNLRGDLFGQEGAWLDKSNKETSRGGSESAPSARGNTGEVELAYDPVKKKQEAEAAAEAERAAYDASHPKGPEFTARAIIVGILVAILVGASYPYVVLKLGYGPNISVVSAFFGYLFLSVVGFLMTKLSGKDQRSTRVEYNIIQTAGSSAGQTAFMCVLLAAFDLLASKPELHFNVSLSPLQVFLWLSVAGCLGVLLAVPLRKHYIDEENLTFADGVAAGETLLVLDEGKSAAKQKLRWLLGGGLFAFVFAWFRDGAPKFIPGAYFPDKAGSGYFEKLNLGMEWSPLSIGSGMLVGLRITLSMAIGTAISWVLLPTPLANAGFIAAPDYPSTIKWVMWPATGLMVAGGLTALALKWKLIVKTFRELKGASTKGGDFPMSWVIVGSIVLSIALVIIQKVSLGVAYWESIVAILVSIPLMLVGIRVLGETNWAPVSSMANMVQAIFAALSPGNIPTNMVASGMSGTVAGSGEQLMQDYKAGKIVGSTNRHLTYMQLIATPIGAAAVAVAYPLFKSMYGIGGNRYGIAAENAHSAAKGLSAPISVKWAGFAELLSGGISKLPPYALSALVVGVVLGVVITLLESKWKDYLPSPTGISLGMLIPGASIIPMVVGGLIQFIWNKSNKEHEEAVSTPLSSGLIVGEAMVVLILAVLAAAHWLQPLSDWMLPFTNFVNEKLGMSLFINGEGGGH